MIVKILKSNKLLVAFLKQTYIMLSTEITISNEWMLPSLFNTNVYSLQNHTNLNSDEFWNLKKMCQIFILVWHVMVENLLMTLSQCPR